MNESLVVGTCHPGDVSGHYTQSLVATIADDSTRGSNSRILARGGTILVQSGPRIAAARNQIVEQFLGLGSSWLLMIDADMTWAPKDIDKLMSVAHPRTAPIIGGLCFGGGRSGEMFPTLYVLQQSDVAPIKVVMDYPEDSVVQVDATGAAFLLMHRDALLRMQKVFEGSDYPWFIEGTSYRGMKFGEDWAFCLRARGLDMPVQVHTGVKIGHMKPMLLDEFAYQAYRQRVADVGLDGVKQQFRERIGAA